MKSLYLVLLVMVNLLIAEEKKLVNIAPGLGEITTYDHGVKVTIQRIQDPLHRLTDDFTKTSRPCPPFCIQPITPVEGVHNIEELELINFIQEKIPSKKGLLIDARLKNWYETETIPGAINIPFDIVNSDDPKVTERLFELLGAKKRKDGTFDFRSAKELAVFCNGVWCGQSPHFIRGIMKHGYPANKIYYYRSGFQGWKLLGLTTVIHKANEAKSSH